MCISISNAPVTLFTISQPTAAPSSLLVSSPSMRVVVSLTLPPKLTDHVKHTVMTTTYCKKKSLPIFIVSSNYSTRCFINSRPLPPTSTLTRRTTNPQHGQLDHCGRNRRNPNSSCMVSVVVLTEAAELGDTRCVARASSAPSEFAM